MSLTGGRPKRLVWIVNHRTLIDVELAIFDDLGYEVFVPKIIPDDPEYPSGVITYDYDRQLTISSAALRILNNHNFYLDRWRPTITQILNDHFDAVITSVSAYTTPLLEAVANFQGSVVARVFGRDHPRRYTEFFDNEPTGRTLNEIAAIGDRFVFGQAFDNLADIEDPVLKTRARTISVPIPVFVRGFAGTWSGSGDSALLVCPRILAHPYYRDQYDNIKRSFGSLPHMIFGEQLSKVDDSAVLGYVPDDELIKLYASAPVFVYPSTEPRHVHYSPLEAMVIGTPVLYRSGALLDTLCGDPSAPGACADMQVMHDKTAALLAGDHRLAGAMRQSQQAILCHFTDETARRQWAEVLT